MSAQHKTTIPENLRGFSRTELRRRAAILQALSEQRDRPRGEQRELARQAAEMEEASKHAD